MMKKCRKPNLVAAFSFGAPAGIRTPDLLIRSQLLYPAELRAHVNGGERGIRTLDTSISPCNRLAGDRLQPTRPSLHNQHMLFLNPSSLAEGVGFEPTAPCRVTGFQDRLLKPLGHPSLVRIKVYHNPLPLVNNHRLFNPCRAVKLAPLKINYLAPYCARITGSFKPGK
jgi:hypothetical protein